MLNRANHNIALANSRARGGTFFTMLIFVMLLISSALMYYYFQRTQSLQREVAALKSGMGGVTEEKSSLWDWLPWNKSNDGDADEEVAGSATSEGTETPGDTSAGQEFVTNPEDSAVENSGALPPASEAQLPPSGAASTPRPNTEAMAPIAEPSDRLNLFAETTSTQILEPVEMPAESADSQEPVIEEGEDRPTSDQPAQAEEDAENRQPIQSMYDQLPPVRVRSPRQNRE